MQFRKAYLNQRKEKEEAKTNVENNVMRTKGKREGNIPEMRLNCLGLRIAGQISRKKMKELTARVRTSVSFGHF